MKITLALSAAAVFLLQCASAVDVQYRIYGAGSATYTAATTPKYVSSISSVRFASGTYTSANLNLKANTKTCTSDKKVCIKMADVTSTSSVNFEVTYLGSVIPTTAPATFKAFVPGSGKGTQVRTFAVDANFVLGCPRQLGNGDGKTGECCKVSDDCIDTCNSNGLCGVSGEVPPPVVTPPVCNRKLGQGDGKTGQCCQVSDDCIDSCVKNICGTGVAPTSTSTATKPTTTTTPPPVPTCARKLGQGDGKTGQCCKVSDDCIDSCVNNICGTGADPTTTTTSAKPTTTPTCTRKLGQGDGVTGACCKVSDDCVDTCKSGKCTSG